MGHKQDINDNRKKHSSIIAGKSSRVRCSAAFFSQGRKLINDLKGFPFFSSSSLGEK